MNSEPKAIRAGDSATWSRTMAQYLAGNGWALQYRLVPQSGGCAYDIAAAADGDGFLVELPSSETSSWAAGLYTLVGVMSRAAERVTVYASPLMVAPNLMDSPAVDGRSKARIIVEAIDSYFATGDVAVLERQHADRMLRNRSHAELIQLRSFYAAQLAGEDQAERLAEGLGTGSRFVVRM